LLMMTNKKHSSDARNAAKRLADKYNFSYRDWKHNKIAISVEFHGSSAQIKEER